MDSVYKKQLEAFGTEHVRIVDQDTNTRRREALHKANLDFVASMMSTIHGRKWMYDKLDLCRVFSNPFVGGQADATAYLCGMQMVGQLLLDEVMQAAPEQFYAMNQEAIARRTTNLESQEDATDLL